MMKYERFTKRIGDFVTNHCKPSCPYYNVCEDDDCHCDKAALEILAELEDKIENGTLVELPCKVGDTVYCVYSPPHPADHNDKGKWFMGEFEVAGFYYGVKGLSIKIYCYGNVNEKEIGKTIFLTSEEAEKRLKELQNGQAKAN